jgi:hypothetical protein
MWILTSLESTGLLPGTRSRPDSFGKGLFQMKFDELEELMDQRPETSGVCDSVRGKYRNTKELFFDVHDIFVCNLLKKHSLV